MPSRSFTSPTAGEDVVFELDGVTYHAVPMLPAGFAFDLLRYGNSRAAEFFDIILREDDRELFAAAIRSTDKIVPQQTVDELLRWLVEVYTGRPTGPSNGSSPGANVSADASTA